MTEADVRAVIGHRIIQWYIRAAGRSQPNDAEIAAIVDDLSKPRASGFGYAMKGLFGALCIAVACAFLILVNTQPL
ncbi:hypothetical protein JQ594_15295 [Bradyrhizobium manausense]|uniref:hypothetical protein n=1 Tax=Bradyrhizobium manausense TaxID=989370 RepID=UPI001BADD08B|nr:hypothetical protein [Bradyrhizobium manausense]MBR0687295.1 hypothetical protein [Bradyrhizobium manausense]